MSPQPAARRVFAVPLPGRAPLLLGERTLVMGVLNLTHDSFSSDGLAGDPARAIDQVQAMVEAGADLIDIGAESTRPGSLPVSEAEELARLRPVLRAIGGRVAVPLSIDTSKAAVAHFALDEGVAIVNDVTALGGDPVMAPLIAARGVPVLLMHMRGRPREMYAEARYGDVVAEVMRDLQRKMEVALGAGIGWDRLLIDPGIGFAKTSGQSFDLLAGTARLSGLGRPMVIGASRKSFLSEAIGSSRPESRDWATAAAVTHAVLAGAHVVRVHRVGEMAQVVKVADRLRTAAATEVLR
ncbi:MAG: dihydropteroate synthase [Acidobacteria bacterium]|nr:dihydropteroate synthase [Acidobacteriota bacterium]